MHEDERCRGCDGQGSVLVDDGLEIPYEIECERCDGYGVEPLHLRSVPSPLGRMPTEGTRPVGQN